MCLPCQIIFFKNLKNICWNSGQDEKVKNFPKSHFSSKSSSEYVQSNFDKPAVTLSPKTRKTFPNSKKDEVTIFWSDFFFHQKWFSSNRECNPDNPTKKFCPKNHRFAAHIPINDEKNHDFFDRKRFFLKLCFCTCRNKLWPTCQKILVKTLKTFCWNSAKDGKMISYAKNLFVKMFFWTCTTIFDKPALTMLAKDTEDLFRSKSENDSNAIFLEKNSLNSFLQKLRKIFMWTRRMQLWQPCQNFLVKLPKTFARSEEKMKNW